MTIDEFRKPHSSIRPLLQHRAPSNCDLRAHMDEAYFQDVDGRWIRYYKDGHFATADEVERQRGS